MTRDNLVRKINVVCLGCGNEYEDIVTYYDGMSLGSEVHNLSCCSYHKKIITNIEGVDVTLRMAEYLYDYNKFLDYPWPRVLRKRTPDEIIFES